MTHTGNPDDILDVLIVGAGLAGISAAVHLKKHLPHKRYAILERREAMGGTWDLFRYPGVRCDSDMYTLGFNFKPWISDRSITDGQSICDYVTETAAEYGVTPHIRLGHKVLSANWSSGRGIWEVVAETANGARVDIAARFLSMCAGYYDYDQGYTPDYPGLADFKGDFLHPQLWPKDYDYSGKRVVIIGSGATAVTMLPVMGETAARVTMLQRSPGYIFSRPSVDKFAMRVRKFLPQYLAYKVVRIKNIVSQRFTFTLARKKPEMVKGKLIEATRAALPAGFDVDTHFQPRYYPWEERLCLVPDDDLFKAIHKGNADIVTDHIDRFVENGILLKSGKLLEADVIVSATGLKLAMAGKARLSLDHVPVNFPDHMTYKGVMFNDIPNMTLVFGYTNASWTLKADLVSEFVCRLLKTMVDKRVNVAIPRCDDANMPREPMTDFSSGYFQRAAHLLPTQGNKQPWKLNMSYERDIRNLRYGKIDDGTMEFKRVDALAVAPPVILAEAAE